MASETGGSPIIIIKKNHKHDGHHGGAWKVAYADFVTAMMAFFLVMWIVGLDKPTREAIAAYFKDPVGFMKAVNGGKSPISTESSSIGKPAILPTAGGQSQQAAVQAQFKTVANEILKELAKHPEFQGLRDSVEVHLTNEGLRIELMEKTPSLFFDTGSAHLKARTVRLLQTIARQLRALDNPVMIEGHTDSRPLGRPGYSNWELSTDRANSARRAMETNGLRPGQVLAVRGYADRKLLRPDDPTHFSNRRVSILVAYEKKG
ncbi:MAG TPA: flagellar motor protein MotB [Chthonomonadaceae bacterium]|nr:flagellar motor protein MotB [Chthonomonadaceae bacterium]